MTALSLQNFWTALQALSEQLPFNDECVTTLSVSVGTEDPTLVEKLHRRYGGRLGDDGHYVAFVSNDGVRYLQVTFVGDQNVDSETSS